MITKEIDSPDEINDIYGTFRLWLELSSAKNDFFVHLYVCFMLIKKYSVNNMKNFGSSS